MKPTRRKHKSETLSGITAEEAVNQGGNPMPETKPGSLRSWFGRVFSFVPRWFDKIKGPVGKAWNWGWGRLRKYISPAFLVILGLSALFWYTLKLQSVYTAEVPVRFNIEGTMLRANVVVEATGYKILSQRYASRKEIPLTWDDIEITPSSIDPRAVVISPLSLQNIISLRYTDLKIVSMGNIPEIEP